MKNDTHQSGLILFLKTIKIIQKKITKTERHKKLLQQDKSNSAKILMRQALLNNFNYFKKRFNNKQFSSKGR